MPPYRAPIGGVIASLLEASLCRRGFSPEAAELPKASGWALMGKPDGEFGQGHADQRRQCGVRCAWCSV